MADTTWSTASFRVYGGLLDRDEISKRLGRIPKPLNPNGNVALQQRVWGLESRLDRKAHSVEEHIADVLEQVDDFSDRLHLVPGHVLEIFVGAAGPSGNFGFELSPGLLSRMAELELSPSLDLYHES